jgi:hypothetical protein
MATRKPRTPTVEMESSDKPDKGPFFVEKPGEELPVDIVYRKIPSISKQVAEADNPLEYEPSIGDRALTLLARTIIDRGLRASDVPLERKVDWAFRAIGQFEGMRSSIWVQDDSKVPKTVAELEAAKQQKAANVLKLSDLLTKMTGNVSTTPEQLDATITTTLKLIGGEEA